MTEGRCLTCGRKIAGQGRSRLCPICREARTRALALERKRRSRAHQAKPAASTPAFRANPPAPVAAVAEPSPEQPDLPGLNEDEYWEWAEANLEWFEDRQIGLGRLEIPVRNFLDGMNGGDDLRNAVEGSEILTMRWKYLEPFESYVPQSLDNIRLARAWERWLNLLSEAVG